jgi:hypothetical protein
LCPAGAAASEKQVYVYVSGTGTAEAALVTDGSCARNGSSGTLQFTTVNAHATGPTISSATAGMQEASIAAKLDALSGNPPLQRDVDDWAVLGKQQLRIRAIEQYAHSAGRRKPAGK